MIAQFFKSQAEWLLVCACCGDVSEFDRRSTVETELAVVARELERNRMKGVFVVKHALTRMLWVVRCVKGKAKWEGPESYAEKDVRVRTADGWFIVMATPPGASSSSPGAAAA